jgi:hypothetical protein
MTTKTAQLELAACANAFNLMGEIGVNGAREIAEIAAAMQREREARAWAEKMQRKLSECPGFVGCCPPGVESSGSVTVQPGAADQAVDWLKRRLHVGDVRWDKGLGLTIQVLPRRQGLSRTAVRRRLAPAEQFTLSL